MTWLAAFRFYLLWFAPANFIWEAAHTPLYTLWAEQSAAKIAFAVVHCTGGDLLIGASSLLGTLLLFGRAGWPEDRFWIVAALTVLAGVSYTAYSEWLNTSVRGSWTYTDLMPLIPGTTLGLSPIAQWILIPSMGFWWLHRRGKHFARLRKTSNV